MFHRVLFLALLVASVSAADSLAPQLEPLRPLLKTWKGPFIGGKSEKPMVDVVRFERAMNGQAIRALHSVNDGIYAGETIIYWSKENKRIEFSYFTTLGDRTEGTMDVDKEGAIISNETVKNIDPKAEDPTTKVRATSKILPDGQLHVKSEYFKKAGWVAGHEIIYKETPGAEVVFK